MEVMMQIPASSLDLLKEVFRKNSIKNKGLSQHEFVESMLMYLPPMDSQAEEIQMVEQLCELFSQIDVNGDGSLEWSEFTSHCIEAGILASQVHATPMEYMLAMDNRFVDNLFIRKILQATYIKKLELLAVLENGASEIKLMNLETFELAKTISPFDILERHNILHMEHIDDMSIIMIACADLTIRFWNYVENKIVGIQSCKRIFHFGYTSMRQHVYLADFDGNIFVLQLKHKVVGGKRSLMYFQDTVLTGHSDKVGVICCINQQRSIATGGQDGKVCIWDVVTYRKRAELLYHSRAVSHIEYSEYHELLMTSGFENEIVAWDVETARKIFILKGHQAMPIGMQFMKFDTRVPEEYLTSCDQEGIVKVWRLHKISEQVEIMQTLSACDHVNVDKPMQIFSPLPNELLLTTRRFRRMHAVPVVYQEIIPAGIAYSPALQRFYIAGGRELQIWDAVKGVILTKIVNIVPDEITTYCLDNRKRKIFLGTVSGTIITVNAENGSVMKSLNIGSYKNEIEGIVCPEAVDPSHSISSQLTAMHYSRHDKSFVAIFGNAIFVVDDNEVIEKATGNTMPVLRGGYNLHQTSVVASAFDSGLSLIATTSDKDIRFWDFEMFRFEGECIGHEDTITSMVFVPDHPLLVAADNSGIVRVWTTRPHPLPYGCISMGSHILRQVVYVDGHRASFEDPLVARPRISKADTQPVLQNTIQQSVVVNLRYVVRNGAHTLITADRIGNVAVWDLASAMEKWNIKPTVSAREHVGYNPSRHAQVSFYYLMQRKREVERTQSLMFPNAAYQPTEKNHQSCGNDIALQCQLVCLPEEIMCLEYVTDLDAVVVSSNRGAAYAFSQFERYVGKFDVNVTIKYQHKIRRASPWFIGIDMEAKRREQHDYARKLLLTISKKRMRSSRYGRSYRREVSKASLNHLPDDAVIVKQQPLQVPSQRPTSPGANILDLLQTPESTPNVRFPVISLESKYSHFQSERHRRSTEPSFMRQRPMSAKPSAMLEKAVEDSRARRPRTRARPRTAPRVQTTEPEVVSPSKSPKEFAETRAVGTEPEVHERPKTRKSSRQRKSIYLEKNDKLLEHIDDILENRICITSPVHTTQAKVKQAFGKLQTHQDLWDEQERRKQPINSRRPLKSALKPAPQNLAERYLSTGNGAKLKKLKQRQGMIGPYAKSEVLRLSMAFDKIDYDGSGEISCEEFVDNFDAILGGVSSASATELFQSIDQDNSGSISLDELMRIVFPLADSIMIEEMIYYSDFTKAQMKIKKAREKPIMTDDDERELRTLFHIYDKDHDGAVSLYEIFELLNYRPFHKKIENDPDLIFPMRTIKQILGIRGDNRDRTFSEVEFVKVMFEFQTAET